MSTSIIVGTSGVASAFAAASTLSSRPKSEQLAAEAARLRKAEGLFNEAAAHMGLGAAAAAVGGIAGRTAGTLLGIGAGVAAVQGVKTGKQAAEIEKKAEEAKKEEAQQEAPKPAEPAAPQPAPAAPATPPAKKKSKSDDGGRIDFVRGERSYGGRASEHRPDRRDAISRTC
jgi:hypothetical protein